jgi:hypothetical protein
LKETVSIKKLLNNFNVTLTRIRLIHINKKMNWAYAFNRFKIRQHWTVVRTTPNSFKM